MRALILAAVLTFAGCAAPPDIGIPISPAPACRTPWPGAPTLSARGYRAAAVQDFVAIVDVYNAAPPKSDVRPDHVYIVQSRDPDDEGVVFLVAEGCIRGVMPLSSEVVALLERGGA